MLLRFDPKSEDRRSHGVHMGSTACSTPGQRQPYKGAGRSNQGRSVNVVLLERTNSTCLLVLNRMTNMLVFLQFSYCSPGGVVSWCCRWSRAVSVVSRKGGPTNFSRALRVCPRPDLRTLSYGPISLYTHHVLRHAVCLCN